MKKEYLEENHNLLGDNELVIRRPTDNEQILANVVTSDYQISSITIQSSVLFSLDLIKRVYRSKSTNICLSTVNRVKKYKSVIDKLFYNVRDIEDIQEFYNEINFIKLNELIRQIDFKFIIKSKTDWDNILSHKNIIPVIINSIKKYLEENPMDEDKRVNTIKYLCINVEQYLKNVRKKFANPQAFLLHSRQCRSFEAIMKDDFFEAIKDEVYHFDGSVSELHAFINDFLDKNNHGVVKKHTQTVLNEECLKAQQPIRAWLLKNTGSDELTLQSFIVYIKSQRPYLIERCKNLYHIDLENLGHIENFSDFWNALYRPENIQDIRERLHVNVRARTVGEMRKGSEFIIEQKRYESKRENAKRKLGCSLADFDINIETTKLSSKFVLFKEKEKEYKECKEIREYAKRKIAMLRGTSHKEELRVARAELLVIEDNIKKVARAYRRAKKDYTSRNKEFSKKKRAYDIIKEYEQKELAMLRDLKNNRSYEEYGQLDELEMVFKKTMTEDIDIPYFTWKFICYDMSMATALRMSETLESHLNEGNGVCGESGYINVTPFDITTNKSMKMVQFFVDYPKSSSMFKAFNRNKNLCKTLLDGFSSCMDIPIIYDIDECEYNIPMEKTLQEETLKDAWV